MRINRFIASLPATEQALLREAALVIVACAKEYREMEPRSKRDLAFMDSRRANTAYGLVSAYALSRFKGSLMVRYLKWVAKQAAKGNYVC